MRVALLTNTAWLDEELMTFKAVLVGLLDEGVGAVKVVPAEVGVEELGMMGQGITYRSSRWPWVRAHRLAALAGQLEAAEVNLIHALDGRLWRGARRLGEAMDLPVIYQANSYLDLRHVESILHGSSVPRVAFGATTEPLAEAIRQIAGEDVEVTVICPGVYSTGSPPRTRDPNQALCAIVSGSGRLDAYMTALLAGLTLFVEAQPQTLVFFDNLTEQDHQLWRAANRAGLGSNLSMVPRKLGHREMLLKADLLIHPQPLGRSRSITLAAMAHGLPVLAAADPWLDYLIDGQTAWVLDEPTPQAYHQRLADVVAHPEHGRSLGESAQQWVRHGRLASDMIGRTVGLYRQVSGEAIEFPG